jgi:hypothetical protein
MKYIREGVISDDRFKGITNSVRKFYEGIGRKMPRRLLTISSIRFNRIK